jgi:hypothetical protein
LMMENYMGIMWMKKLLCCADDEPNTTRLEKSTQRLSALENDN